MLWTGRSCRRRQCWLWRKRKRATGPASAPKLRQNRFKYRATHILRFLGYLKGTNEISTTALARCEKAVKYFESKEDVSFIKKVEVLRKESDLSPMEIAFLMWNYDQIEIYVKLKKLLTNEQVLRFAHSITKPNTSIVQIQEKLEQLQELFGLVGHRAFKFLKFRDSKKSAVLAA